ncbi:hypothetical protein FXN61_09400 [Lentzea sp. PSKA42]|uniref:SH3 domain-containing protein n=1 Tax=Lentzea indica TaxID=2604800 RepID=A0ABX1FDP4_9PSEU|nr:hypothetical protein [Lentzea indica]NKE57040.1 hypothetical protein [Lentzea indica]
MKIASVAGATGLLLAAATSMIMAGPANAAGEKPLGEYTGLPDTVETTAPGDVSAMHCGHAHSNRDTRTGNFFDANAVAIRRGPHTPECAADGQGQLSHRVDYHCWTNGDAVTRGGVTYRTWSYLRDVTTGVSGWVSDAYLDRNPASSRGSTSPC